MNSVELLLHPVRLRIVQAFLGDRTLTTSELNAELGDVPPGSLYRHMARLVDAGVLEVVTERRVRGTVERTYRLRLDAAQVTPDQLDALGPEDHRRAFMAYIAGVLADFDRYLDRGEIDYVRDGVGYRTLGMWLDDDEFADFVADLRRIVEPRLANTAAPGRKRRLLRTVFIPDGPGTESESTSERR
ncbi:helix-turn-helix domain-containing protein [Nocardia sp. ET3-3]|uniref:Helix-turn-helix domain-containing protein n=1 Tax=Nocardia terrae TaxID=2675851 RepID=A0A7K1UVQ8_9NOCA|nr:helix-turn-helix domain-containing protein [Nocardia terrae]